MRWIPAERMAIAVETNQSRTDPALLLADLAGLALTPPPALRGLPDALTRCIREPVDPDDRYQRLP